MKTWANQAGAGNGARARLFHAEALGRAVPDLGCWAHHVVMRHTVFIGLGFVLTCGLSGCSTVAKSPRERIVRYSDPSERPDILSYPKPSAETLGRIKVQDVSLTKERLQPLTGLPKTKTTNGVRWFIAEEPDTTRDGPWTTRLYIIDSANTNCCLRVELIDHASYGVRPHWLNDKMLFVNVWWGRIAWTDFVLDTETARIGYIEDGRLDAVLDGLEQKHEK